MKSSKEWSIELDPRMGIEERERDIERIERIQADAKLYYITLAANIVKQLAIKGELKENRTVGSREYYEAILNARDNLTTL